MARFSALQTLGQFTSPWRACLAAVAVVTVIGVAVRPYRADATASAMAELIVEDDSGAELRRGYGAFVAPSLVVAAYHLVYDAAGGHVEEGKAGELLPISGIVASSPKKDLVILRVIGAGFPTTPVDAADILNMYRHLWDSIDADDISRLLDMATAPHSFAAFRESRPLDEEQRAGFAYRADRSSVKFRASLGEVDAVFQLGRDHLVAAAFADEATQAKHYRRAVRYLTEAKERGHSGASAELGLMHIRGDGLEQDSQLGWSKLQKAAETGDAIANTLLGNAHVERARYGDGSRQPSADYADAHDAYFIAAKQGNAQAQYELAQLYQDGHGANRDLVKAHAWYTLAVDGIEYVWTDDARERLSAIEDSFTPDDRQSAERVVTTLASRHNLTLSASAKQPQPVAQRNTSESSTRTGTAAPSEDTKRKASDILRAAPEGDAEAQYRTAIAMYDSATNDNGRLMAIGWLERAAEQHHAEAAKTLGLFFLAGEVVDQDLTAAAKYFRIAADQGDPEGQYLLGLLYQNGVGGLPRDQGEAGALFFLAALQNQEDAQYELGLASEEGRGMTADLRKAHVWLSLAEAQGVEGAQEARMRVETQLTPDELAHAKRSARNTHDMIVNQPEAAQAMAKAITDAMREAQTVAKSETPEPPAASDGMPYNFLPTE